MIVEYCEKGGVPVIEVIPWDLYYARGFVHKHMSWDGCFRDTLLSHIYAKAYSMCDGFERMPMAHDWSHVRDSSFGACWKVADFIAKEVWGCEGIQAFIDKRIEQAKRLDIDMMSLLP